MDVVLEVAMHRKSINTSKLRSGCFPLAGLLGFGAQLVGEIH